MNASSPDDKFWGQVTQKALIRKGKKVLLNKYPKHDAAAGLLDMPGGRLHVGESVVDGLKREVFEEIGVGIEIHKILATGTMVNMSGNPSYFVIYEASLVDENPNFVLQSDEVEELGWFEIKDFLSLPIIYKEYKEALTPFLN